LAVSFVKILKTAMAQTADFIVSVIKENGKRFQSNPQDVLYNYGDMPIYVYVLEDGTVILSDPNTQRHKKITGRDDVLGLREAILNYPYHESAKALQVSNVYRLSRNDFLEMLQNSQNSRVSLIKHFFTYNGGTQRIAYE